LQPGEGIIREGVGHVVPYEEPEWFDEMLMKFFEKGERLNGVGK